MAMKYSKHLLFWCCVFLLLTSVLSAPSVESSTSDSTDVDAAPRHSLWHRYIVGPLHGSWKAMRRWAQGVRECGRLVCGAVKRKFSFEAFQRRYECALKMNQWVCVQCHKQYQVCRRVRQHITDEMVAGWKEAEQNAAEDRLSRRS
jgi:hypothetical protein